MKEKVQTIKVTARSLDAALQKAALLLETHEEEVNYRILNDKGPIRSLLAMFSRKIVIEASKQKNHRTGEVHAAPLSAQKMRELVEDLRKFCAEICSRIVGEKVQVTTLLTNGRLVLNVNNALIGEMISKNPKFTESLEHLLRKKPRYLKRELPFRIFVDAQDLRQDREEDLARLAQDLSDQVNENQKPIVLNYKNPNDRRIIHMALDKDDRVYTKSIGSGTNRKLMILPANRGHLQRSSASSRREESCLEVN